MGVDAMPGYEQGTIKPITPTIDSIARSGITYENVWTTPACTPTRAAILSGKYGIKTGVMRPPGNLDLEHTSLFNVIKDNTDNAYATALIGKWHISNPQNDNHPSLHGVDYFSGIIAGTVDDYYNWEKTENGTKSDISEYITSHLTDTSIEWIDAQSDPWILSLSHIAPHAPFHNPPQDLHVTTTDDNQGQYFAAIEAMDAEIGRLLRSLDKSVLDNTLILFIGDNGTPNPVLQYHLNRHGKGSLYEGGIHVPMIVSGYGVDRVGERESGLVQGVDLYATILDLIGIDLEGGIHNSLSIRPSFSCSETIDRAFIYSDFNDNGTLQWAIRNHKFKLIADENGAEEFYDLGVDPTEENNLVNILNSEELTTYNLFKAEATIIRNGWSCQDGIKNGNENFVDDCENDCSEVDELSYENIGCCEIPEYPSVYYEFAEGDKRMIYTNGFPNHDYCFNNANIPEETHHLFGIDATPERSDQVTPVVGDTGRPQRYFGVAINGVIMAPAPAAPFIFENPNTGEYNWDWVFEPTTNQGDGRGKVGLDCASAHTGPQGYHYHGEMYEYIETIAPGLTTLNEVPAEPMHIGWASDGFPILYRYGPDQEGKMKKLTSSYRLKSGLRPGDGIMAPCGPYSGKYTVDYAYNCGSGDLDECNGMASKLILDTELGEQEFDYYYVITSEFPQIPRCLVGIVSTDFENSAPILEGVDADGDGFLSEFDCDDSDAAINPLAAEIPGNDIDENCDNSITSVIDGTNEELLIWPNPSLGGIRVQGISDIVGISIYGTSGVLVYQSSSIDSSSFIPLDPGIYFVALRLDKNQLISKKIIVL